MIRRPPRSTRTDTLFHYTTLFRSPRHAGKDVRQDRCRRTRDELQPVGFAGMRCIVVGLGVQGHKRRRVAGADFVAAVDPVHPEATYRHISDVPLKNYDAALCCPPSAPTADILRSSERRVGKWCTITCNSRWSPYHLKKNNN